MGTVTQLNLVALPDVAGYVEALTGDRVLGWAWAPRQPDVRLAVELRLGSEVVARTTAERPRADLASSGIGDGKHAFELVIPETHRTRARELGVWARVGDSEPVAITPPPQSEPMTDQLVRLARGLDAVIGSQRVLHRNLQSGLANQPDAATLAKLLETQTAMAEQLAAVERFVVRLDERFLGLVPDAKPASRSVPPAALWALGIAALAFLVSVAGLVHSLAE